MDSVNSCGCQFCRKLRQLWLTSVSLAMAFFNFSFSMNIREIKFDVKWSYVKRQAAKMKLLLSVFSSLNSRVKIFVFVENSRRHFSIFM